VAAPIVVLAGGVGAARFLDGLVRAVEPERVTVIGNTADDLELHGLAVSPDLDTVCYTLAGLNDPKRGWGLAGESFHALEALGRFTGDTWFQLGDRDLATHIYRTHLIREGASLRAATERIACALGVKSRVLPMTNEPVRTYLETSAGRLDFQTYFVKRRAEDEVRSVEFAGVDHATPTPGVLDAIADAEVVIVAPSNPIISIGPILAVPGIRRALTATQAPVVGVTPIVAGESLKGPTARMMHGLGMEVSARRVAELYRDFLAAFVLDERDRDLAAEIEAMGIRGVIAQTIMRDTASKCELARAALRAAER
jgi:LPPG:FO 2-phospho-L-lactate transferase